MKKLLVLFLSVVAVFATAISFTACGNDSGDNGGTVTHVHNFNRQDTSATYLKSDATCTQKAKYYYSCECGEKGTETFEYGNKLSHNFNRQDTSATYLKSDATCTSKAVYYYSCECGACGTNTFSYGEILEHDFDNWEITIQPSCTSFGEETRVCKRNSLHKETRSVGMLPHNYNNQKAEDRYIKSYANYTDKAVYYYSCKCGAIGEQTFEYGDTVPLPVLTVTFNPDNGENNFTQAVLSGNKADEPTAPQKQDYEF